MSARPPLASLLCALVVLAQEATPVQVRTLTYASRDGADLVLDLYLPATPLRRRWAAPTARHTANIRLQ